MPTYVAGKDSYATFSGLNIGSALANEVRMAMSGREIEISVMGLSWAQYIQGLSDLTLDISGVWDAGTAATALDAVLWAAINGGGTKLWEYMPQGSATNRTVYKGNALATGYEVSSPVGDMVGFSLSLRGSDTPTRSIAV
ncbi:MAG: hypothetical protein ABIH03_01335 [Pseudomonadota bacterium]